LFLKSSSLVGWWYTTILAKFYTMHHKQLTQVTTVYKIHNNLAYTSDGAEHMHGAAAVILGARTVHPGPYWLIA